MESALQIGEDGSSTKEGSDTNSSLLDGSTRSSRSSAAACGLGTTTRPIAARGTAEGWGPSSGGGLGGSSVTGVQDATFDFVSIIKSERVVLVMGNLLVDHVNNTVAHEHIGSHNLGIVDEDSVVINGDGHRIAFERFDLLAVGQRATVADGTSDNVVGQDGCQLVGGQG